MPPQDKPKEGHTTHHVKDENNVVRPLRTFQDDMASLIEENKTTISGVLEAEEKRRRETGERRAPKKEEVLSAEKKARNKRLFLFGGVLVGLGIIAIALVFFLQSETGETLIQGTSRVHVSLIAADQKQTIALREHSREKLLSAIEEKRREGILPLGRVEEIIIQKSDGSEYTANEIMPLLAPSLSQSFVRALEPRFFFGLTQVGYREAFLILDTTSFHAGYGGLLDWEVSAIDEVGQILARLDGAAYKAATKTAGPVPSSFSDELFLNRDVRVLRDQSGDISLMYSIIDRSTILIASSEESFKEALERLAARRSIREANR